MDVQNSSLLPFFRSIILHYRFLINWPSSLLKMLAVPCFLFEHPVQFPSPVPSHSALGPDSDSVPPHNQPSVFPYRRLASFSNFYITPPFLPYLTNSYRHLPTPSASLFPVCTSKSFVGYNNPHIHQHLLGPSSFGSSHPPIELSAPSTPLPSPRASCEP